MSSQMLLSALGRGIRVILSVLKGAFDFLELLDFVFSVLEIFTLF